jgi:hypothetical protein
MIVYDLTCVCGLTFEGWFQDRHEFLSQQDKGLLVCPGCGGNDIRKILSPVATCTSLKNSLHKQPDSQNEVVSEKSVLEALHTIKKFVEKNFENVGAKLAEESLKIHYGIAEARNIRGVVTEQEEKVLTDEGIDLLKIPVIYEDDQLN